MVFRHWEYRRCDACDRLCRYRAEVCTNAKLELGFSCAIELLIDRWVIAVELDVG